MPVRVVPAGGVMHVRISKMPGQATGKFAALGKVTVAVNGAVVTVIGAGVEVATTVGTHAGAKGEQLETNPVELLLKGTKTICAVMVLPAGIGTATVVDDSAREREAATETQPGLQTPRA